LNAQNFINKTEDYIENNLHRKICLDDVAYNIGLSKYHFHRMFRDYTTETIAQYITRIKMERSGIYLVIDSDISITKIAYRYGYCDASSYNKAFRKHYGMNPSQFRLSKKIQVK
jgi:AraC-like DNA-binding protein